MNHLLSFVTTCMLFLVCAAFNFGSIASAAPGDDPSDGPRKGPRKLAPGVLTVIPTILEEKETFSGPREVVEFVHGVPDLEWIPNFSPQSDTLLPIAGEAIFRRPVWCLEFGFKPVRMIYVDVPQPSGKMQRKLIWYMVYRIQNNGYHIRPLGEPDQWDQNTFVTEPVNHTIRFFPHFVLEAPNLKKAYVDRLIPAAMRPIQLREDPNSEYHDSVSISSVNIPVSTKRAAKPVWGVAMWENVDPLTDYFSIYIKGLTNAYRFQDPKGVYQLGDAPATGRKYTYKTLRMNFWRPGDSIEQHEREIRFGTPEDVDYQWVFR